MSKYLVFGFRCHVIQERFPLFDSQKLRPESRKRELRRAYGNETSGALSNDLKSKYTLHTGVHST
ncbi:hypothetical protein RvY_03797 [Ramazzottius varieornatus]|uniref:Uncharacterized protein n=1 Tax=Ramazzottius varieornatus TaxID=947166 RepID=A0A1D1UPA9_RAMVA|nr:hypothetical protein RvY_03797 [Ramazzottius varieornatus]